MNQQEEATSILFKRHGDLHFANLKYGYVVLLLSLLYLVYELVVGYKFTRTLKDNGNRRNIWAILHYASPLKKVFVWLIALTVLELIGVFHYHDKPGLFLKRLGRMAVALLPLDIIIAFRPSVVLFSNYLDLIGVHRWLSRVILLFSVLHSIGFFIKWIVEGNPHYFLLKCDIAYLLLVVFVVLFVVSIKPVRVANYKTFFIVHTLAVGMFVGLIQIHAKPGVLWYVVSCSVLLVYQLFATFFYLCRTKSDSIEDNGGDLSVISIDRRGLPIPEDQLLPHLRLSADFTSSWRKFHKILYPSHPYTIASYDEDHFHLIVSNKNRFQWDATPVYHLSTILYTSPLIAPTMANSINNAIIIVAGSGISMGIPLYHLLSSNAGANIQLVWILRNKADVYILKRFGVTGANVHITKETDEIQSNVVQDEEFEHFLTDKNDTELQDMDPATNLPDGLLEAELKQDLASDLDPHVSSSSEGNKEEETPEKTIYSFGRPKIIDIIENYSSSCQPSTQRWVFSCGPQSLVDDVEDAVDLSNDGKLDSDKIFFAKEVYSM
ncbi:BA75_03759T0 [Komagataella pastoris]|uniref:BA75_03759T0 n=1 Tax=Komagataella pastoris TaxID=4922 RepID=A0A1B2JGJ0_PICPA|nr:BA75_03759T0 [Komagataella pastoris]